ncbi:MAG: hypothetical protein P8N02_13330, partial [Actinomycetota bacterium]|nr:hypothetical protein [Actinomycetota bacterium]
MATGAYGGFLADGSYQPPRSLGRVAALEAWTASLRGRGGEVFDADSSLLTGARLPNLEQHHLLLRNGVGRSFWNMLTITGKIEARGRLLAEVVFPDLQDVIVDDISEMAIGHLNAGLLVAHGLDEGGVLDLSIGGHDAIEGLLTFLQNLLIIEFRAEIGFAMTQDILRTEDLFTDRGAAVEEATEIVERIRIDELVHVSSLCLYLGELRSVQFRTVGGGTIAGAVL